MWCAQRACPSWTRNRPRGEFLKGSPTIIPSGFSPYNLLYFSAGFWRTKKTCIRQRHNWEQFVIKWILLAFRQTNRIRWELCKKSRFRVKCTRWFSNYRFGIYVKNCLRARRLKTKSCAAVPDKSVPIENYNAHLRFVSYETVPYGSAQTQYVWFCVIFFKINRAEISIRLSCVYVFES